MIVENAQDRPIVVTLRGRPVVYVVGVELFDELMERLRRLEQRELELSIAVAEKQFADGGTVTLEELESEFGIEGD
ncbi:MAG: Antitoxin RelF [Anaerolineales bacterium]|nr:Antitoxin RelF [Anaerolineales bacterium]